MGVIEAGPELTTLQAQVQEKVAESAERLKVPGVAVGILHGDQEDYIFHGVTSIDNPLEVNSSTYFQIGSTSKTYTATALMILAEQGRLDLNAPLRQYIPEFKVKDESVTRTVTVLQLLNHTAGWVGDIFEDTGDGADALARYVEHLADVEQRTAPGKVASYNNAAFGVAGRLVEKITGREFETAVRELLLDPVGLEESFYYPSEMLTRRFVVGHTEKDDVVSVARPWQLPRSSHPAGGILATIGDQLRYARFHLGDGLGKDGARVIGAESLRRMQQPTTELKGGALGDYVGISWLIRDVGDVRLVAHGGTTNGQLAAFVMVPERSFAIAVLTNANKGGLLHRDIVNWVLEDYLGLTEPEDEPLVLDADELSIYAGIYSSVISEVAVSVEGDHLVAVSSLTDEGRRQLRALVGDEAPTPEPLHLKPLTNDRLIVIEGEAKGIKASVLRDEAGKVTGITMGGRLAQRVD